MRILYYCPEYYFNHGGRVHARGFFGALEELPEVDACFLYPDRNPQEITQSHHGEEVSRGRLWFVPPTLRKIVRFFRPKPGLTREIINVLDEKQCDALVIRTGVRQPSIKAIKAARPRTVICAEVNSAHFDEGFSGIPLRAFFQKWEVSRFNQADAITVVSSYLKDYLKKQGVSPGKIFVNQNGVDEAAVTYQGVSDIRALYGIPQDAFLIGYVGGMETFRRLPEVIEYIASLREAGNDDVYFLMVGDGADRAAVEDAIRKHHSQLRDAVKLAGWQDHAEIPKYLATFDIAIFPFTNAYCSPLKLFEYLAAGLPAIGPDTPAVREVFENGKHLRLVKQDGSNFTSIVLELRNDPALRLQLAEQGKALVGKKYTWKENARNVVHLLTQVQQAVS